MGNIWMAQTAPAVIATPDATYYALFIADGTSSTTAGSLYAKDSSGTVTALTFSVEQAQDAVGSILTDTATVDFTYDDAGNTISAIVPDAAITNAKLANMAQATFKMRAAAAGTGVPIDGTAGQAKTALAIAYADVSGLGTAAQQNTSAFDAAGLAAAAQAASQPVDTDLTAIAGLTATTDNFMQAKASAWSSRTPTQVTADLVVATQALKGLQAAADKKKQDLAYYDIVAQGGADPTGAVDCASIITAAIATFTTAGIIFFPVGTYKLSSTITVSKEVIFQGAGRQHSIIELSSATANGFDVTSNYVGFENLRISTTASSATLRTAGAAINLDNGSVFPGNISNCYVAGCDILFQWTSIILGAHTSWIQNCNLREGGANAAGGAHILVQKYGDRYISRITSDQGSNPTGFAGIRVLETSSLVIDSCNLVHCTTVLALETSTGKNIPSVEVLNTFFDTSTTGLSINPAGTGTVQRCKFTNCWFSSMTANGVTMTGTQWDGITFDNCDFYGNVIGISCPTGGGNWSVQASRFAGNTGSAINVAASAAHFPQIIANHIGPQSAFGVNGTGIIVAAGTYKGLVIANNDVVNNTTNATLGAVTVGAAEAGWYRIMDNAGINPLTGAAVTTPAFPTSTTVVTNTTGRRVTIYLKWGAAAPTVSTINGVATVLPLVNQLATYLLDPGGTIAFTYATAGTWTWVGN